MATDSATIYREIVTKARSAGLAATAALASSRVSLAPLFTIDGLTTPHVQIIVPGEARIPHERSGVGLVYEEFQVAIIQQILRDRFGTWTNAIGHASDSITALVTAMRGNGLASGASGLHNFKPAAAETSMTLSGWGAIRLADEDPNFMAHVDRYLVIYELDSYQ